ncbi:hypothetical protein L249_1699 [Ophiocordyceps polyrhachis-furcata BCC 54312]|uniref:Uncharacterized protein n=1 Tax=Ophiocordyceps polyrhachis-furcata BCC 54312 TaxID=1330021 RepID=A0A367LSF7_9HYPO|nr:hypothetical protein L249_1699 [Ophiocordyceps polyrhachis-furcata BCC 54312]
MQYERLLFDFYVETGGSRFARGLANFVSIDTPGLPLSKVVKLSKVPKTNAPPKRRIELEDKYSQYAFSNRQLLDIIRSGYRDRAL